MLAVIAAMIRIASRPSRKTISAELVITVVALSPSPVFACASSSASSSSSRVVRMSRTPASSAICGGEPVEAAGAVPHQPLDLGRQAGVEGPQLDLGAELEERVGGQAGLLGGLRLAGVDGGLHLVEADLDQVVVGLVAGLLPLGSGKIPSISAVARLVRVLDRLQRDDRRRPRWRRRGGRRARRARPRARRAPRGSSFSSSGERSLSADVAASTKAIPSVISNGVVTSVPETPWSYSTGIRSMKRISCWARRACSSGVNGAAVKWLSSASARRDGRRAPASASRRSPGAPRTRVGFVALGGAALLLVLGRQHRPVAGGDRQSTRRPPARSRARSRSPPRRGTRPVATGRRRGGPCGSA